MESASSGQPTACEEKDTQRMHEQHFDPESRLRARLNARQSNRGSHVPRKPVEKKAVTTQKGTNFRKSRGLLKSFCLGLAQSQVPTKRTETKNRLFCGWEHYPVTCAGVPSSVESVRFGDGFTRFTHPSSGPFYPIWPCRYWSLHPVEEASNPFHELRVFVGAIAWRSKLLSIFFTAFPWKFLGASSLDVIHTAVMIFLSYIPPGRMQCVRKLRAVFEQCLIRKLSVQFRIMVVVVTDPSLSSNLEA